ncbi:Cytochrome b561 and DOMON domain-containing protein [Quillaja saponaria]|uniref:Cytochrome b561 and DOMON domain-containing protein n=1 Tax=Quillaja saponaria TaxID=32244 RepID=A0AAD7LSZ0_QUISA|nr:Cytochrome b561 and DOMON domain-containing protein [Quillaja saponaria]
MSSRTISLIYILAFLFVSFAFSHVQQPPPCSEDFYDLGQAKNITKCKKLRTLGAEFGWSYNNYNNCIHINVLFGTRVEDYYSSNIVWIAWGVNPGNRPKMVGTKAIIGFKQPNNTLLVNTYNITRDTKRGCRLRPSPDSDLGLQVNNKKMAYDNASNFLTIYAEVVLPSSNYEVSKLNHVWQVGYDASNDEPQIHPARLQNVDSTEIINLVSGDGTSGGHHQKYVRVMLALQLRPKETDDYRKYWNMYHHLLGYALLALIIINIFKGIEIMKGDPNWKKAYIAILVFLSAVTLGFEIFTWTKFLLHKIRTANGVQQNVNQSSIKNPEGKDPQQSESTSQL